MRRPLDAIVWWEIRRIPFNLALLLVGIASAAISVFIGGRLFGPDANIGNPFFMTIVYAIAANLCYTLGWISELLWSWGDTTRTEAMRPKVFRTGLVFSVLVTLLPAIALSLMWITHRFR